MTASEIASHLLGNCDSLEQFEVYMFGSTLRGIGEDIDILVVGPAGATLSKLKQELRAASEFLPLHILYMQPSEERRTEFVAREQCVHLKKLALRI
jgi:predicted nucleotidyltransferase